MAIRDIQDLIAEIAQAFPNEWNMAESYEDRQQFVRDLIDTLSAGGVSPTSKWAEFRDSGYTSGAPLQLLADTDTLVDNDGLAGVKTYAPEGVTLFENGKITGIEGELRLITMNYIAKPTSANSTLLEQWWDIGGAVGELYRRPISFPKGNGVERVVTNTTLVYTLDTWETNGAETYLRGNGTFDIYDFRQVITRPITF